MVSWLKSVRGDAVGAAAAHLDRRSPGAHCAASFAAADATPHEEKLARQNARLRLLLASERQARSRNGRFLEALANSDPASSPEEWASRRDRLVCRARRERSASHLGRLGGEQLSATKDEAPPRGETAGQNAPAMGTLEPGPAVVIPIEVHGRTRALVQLYSQGDAAEIERRLATETNRRAWGAWAAFVLDRASLEHRLRLVVERLRRTGETEETRLEELKLDALSEFAAGAGHELNNPLAVVVGRAQLLLARTDDVGNRSFSSHHDQPGWPCSPDPPRFDVRGSPSRAGPGRAARPSFCAIAVRNFQEECAAKGIRLSTEIDETVPPAWTDPDALRHLADIFIRNAMQATSSGGKIQVGSRLQKDELLWWFLDSGRGLEPAEAAHLFDPFYCGRQAGRGLGMGLPRAARIISTRRRPGALDFTPRPGNRLPHQSAAAAGRGAAGQGNPVHFTTAAQRPALFERRLWSAAIACDSRLKEF